MEKKFEPSEKDELFCKAASELLIAEEKMKTLIKDLYSNGVIGKKEMRILSEELQRIKKRIEFWNFQLKPHELEVKASSFFLGLKEAIAIYFKGFYSYGDNQQQSVRSFFVKFLNLDVVVESGRCWGSIIVASLACAMLGGAVGMFLGFGSKDPDRALPILTIVGAAVALILSFIISLAKADNFNQKGERD